MIVRQVLRALVCRSDKVEELVSLVLVSNKGDTMIVGVIKKKYCFFCSLSGFCYPNFHVASLSLAISTVTAPSIESINGAQTRITPRTKFFKKTKKPRKN